jgi:membrane fusion protein, heavy metal efflux system
MNVTGSIAVENGSRAESPREATVRSAGSRWRHWAALALIFTALGGGGGYFAWRYPKALQGVLTAITARVEAKPAVGASPAAPSKPLGQWDGLLDLSDDQRTSMGIETAPVEPQIEPISIELLGTTDYISDVLGKVRPLFEGRVDAVHVLVGQAVKKGDPLVDLFSTELAEAKSVYEIERIQWLYDKRLLEIREALLKTHTVSQQLYDETKNNEMKNRREFEVARDKLLVYGLTDEEVEGIEKQAGADKARLTLRSPIDGVVITRDVVVGNLYDHSDTLLVVAPMDRLWVWGNVFESDLDLVELGQPWEIRFPFLQERMRGKVEYISNRVDPGTHAVRIRTSIPNAQGKLKSDMLVQGSLEIPPKPGRTTVRRTAVVVNEDGAYVFIERTDGRFERRTVDLAQEKDNYVVLDSGLEVGEQIATVGSLLLEQMYEDTAIVDPARETVISTDVH